MYRFLAILMLGMIHFPAASAVWHFEHTSTLEEKSIAVVTTNSSGQELKIKCYNTKKYGIFLAPDVHYPENIVLGRDYGHHFIFLGNRPVLKMKAYWSEDPKLPGNLAFLKKGVDLDNLIEHGLLSNPSFSMSSISSAGELETVRFDVTGLEDVIWPVIAACD